MNETSGVWETGVEALLPADAATSPQVDLGMVSCASAGNCSAVGGYADSSDKAQVLLLTETDGVWAAGVEAVLPSNARVGAGAGFAMSCASPGNCDAVGAYTDRSKNLEPLILSEKAGSWAAGVEGKLPANAAKRKQTGVLNSVACTAPGTCSAVGGYFDKSGDSEAVLLRETAGHWWIGKEAKLPTNAAPTRKYAGETVDLLAVSCSSARSCSAVGSYCAVANCNNFGKGPNSGEQGLLLTESHGRWARGVEAKLPLRAVREGPLQYINSISCASAGNCSAVGSYLGRSNKTHVVLLTETAGHWARGVKAAVPAHASADQYELGVNSVSCSSAGNCTAAGTYSGAGQDNTRPLLLTERAGRWQTGVEVGLPADASSPYQYSWVTVSCASTQNCSGVGFYGDNSNGQQGLLLANAMPDAKRGLG
jgi:hypothetical protein